jgi:biotin operon repressor
LVRKHNPETLRNLAIEIIEARGSFTSANYISEVTGISRDVYKKHGIDLMKLNSERGFFRVGLKPKGTVEERSQYITQLELQCKELIRKEGKSLTFVKLAPMLGGVKFSALYRSGIDIRRLHAECGVVYEDRADLELLETTLVKLIEIKRRYVTRNELAAELDISGSLISLKNFDVAEVNGRYGYRISNRSFERLIGEWLTEIYPDFEIVCQKSFPDCKNKKSLLYDYFVKELDLLVEVDGSSHHDPKSQWYNEGVVFRDKIKTQYAKDKGYSLLRVKVDPKLRKQDLIRMLSGIPLKHGVGQPAAEPLSNGEGSETIRKE